MTSPENQTKNNQTRTWEEIRSDGESPYSYIGESGLDESTIPADDELAETVRQANHLAVEIEQENAQAAQDLEAQRQREEFLLDRAKARKDLEEIALKGAIEASIDEQPYDESSAQEPDSKEPASVGTYATGYMTPAEKQEWLEGDRDTR